jgi:hypothetical protein
VKCCALVGELRSRYNREYLCLPPGCARDEHHAKGGELWRSELRVVGERSEVEEAGPLRRKRSTKMISQPRRRQTTSFSALLFVAHCCIASPHCNSFSIGAACETGLGLRCAPQQHASQSKGRTSASLLGRLITYSSGRLNGRRQIAKIGSVRQRWAGCNRQCSSHSTSSSKPTQFS